MTYLALLEQFFDPARFADAAMYFWMGAVSSFIFFIRLALMLFSGIDGVADFDTDIDVDADVDVGHADTDASFQLFSLLSITAFFMGAGWMGFVARYDWGLGAALSAILAITFGIGLMFLSGYLMLLTKRLESSGGYDPKKAIGAKGKVYLKIPAKGQGQGEVQVDVDGAQKNMKARTLGDEIESFVAVRVVDIDNDETLVVERIE